MWSRRSSPGKARGEASRESLSGYLQLSWTCRVSWNEQLTGACWEVCSVYVPGASGACPVSLPGAGFQREVSSEQGWSKEEQLKMHSSQQRRGAEAVWWLEQTDLSCGALGSFPLPYFPLLSPLPSEKWFCHGQAEEKIQSNRILCKYL